MLERSIQDLGREAKRSHQAQAEMQHQINEMSSQLGRLQQHTGYEVPKPQQPPPPQQPAPQQHMFGGHYMNGTVNPPQQPQDPGRTLPPLMNGTGAPTSSVAPMQGIQYTDDRR